MRYLWLVGGMLLLNSSLPAQDDSRLLAAVRLAQDGQGDSARSIVLDLISRTPPSDTLYPQIVYTMGIVARDGADRSRNFRRVAVEYAGSNWADDALLGLAEEDFAAGRAEESARSLERIKADYPSSPILPTVSYWATRAYFELNRPAQACQWLAQGKSLAGEDVELQNQLAFYQPRCDAAVASTPPAGQPTSSDTVISRPPATPSPLPAPSTPSSNPPAASASGAGGAFAVQVAAVGSDAAAQGTITALRGAGFEPRVVREGGFIKIRVGHFAQRAEAVAAASQVRSKLGGSPFVVVEQ